MAQGSAQPRGDQRGMDNTMPVVTASFYVGGHYVEHEDGTRMTDQVFVRSVTLQNGDDLPPVVMIHGGGGTGTIFEGQPNNPGWVEYFVQQGFSAYVVDQPGRGRSFTQPGPLARSATVRHVEQRHTAPQRHELWPQARLHSQWPGSGEAGDSYFDQFYASRLPGLNDPGRIEELMRAAGAELLDRIGGAVVLTHSQSGAIGWQIADARPGLVKAVVAIEPSGPPFIGIRTVGEPDHFVDGKFVRPYGLSNQPLTYDPPVGDPAIDLPFEKAPREHDTFAHCYVQRGPARKLVNLLDIPVLVVTSEASYHAGYDHCTVDYLRQAGVTVTHLRLEQAGIHGNGHFMMLEANSALIAEQICKWLRETLCT